MSNGLTRDDLREIINEHSGEDPMKVRSDYAYKWFEYHAGQRTTMFNFFLIITGILANAYVTVLGKNLFDIAIGLGIVGALTSLGFLVLDFRNKQLVGLGEEVLKKLEADYIFKDYKKEGEKQIGILLNDPNCKMKSHGFWLPIIEISVLLFFLFSVCFSFQMGRTYMPPKQTDISQLNEEIKRLGSVIQDTSKDAMPK